MKTTIKASCLATSLLFLTAAIAPTQTPQQVNAPTITSIEWSAGASGYVVRGVCPNNYTGQVEIFKEPGHVLVASGTATDGYFSISCNPAIAGANSKIHAETQADGAGPEANVPRQGAKKAKTPRRPNQGSSSSVEGSLDVRTSYFDMRAAAACSITQLDIQLQPGVHVVTVRTTADGLSGAGRENTPTAWVPLLNLTVQVDPNEAAYCSNIPFLSVLPLQADMPRGLSIECSTALLPITPAFPPSTWYEIKPSIFLMPLGQSMQPGAPPVTTGVFKGNLYVEGFDAPGAWQQNRPGLYLCYDGLVSNGVEPAISEAATASSTTSNAPHVILIDAIPGSLADVAITLAPIVAFPGFPALATPDGQRINIDLTSPTLLFMNSGTGSILPLPSAGPRTIAINPPITPIGVLVSAQAVVLNPSSTGTPIELSQAIQFQL